MTCGPASPGTPQLPWSPAWRRCVPGPAAPSATPPASRCASWDGARSSPGTQLERLDELIAPRVRAHAPGLLALYGIGAHTAALLLIAAADHPECGGTAIRRSRPWSGRRSAGPGCATTAACRGPSAGRSRSPPHWRAGPHDRPPWAGRRYQRRSEEHTSELQSRLHLVCRLLLEKKKQASE